jgi:hypothetical protein
MKPANYRHDDNGQLFTYFGKLTTGASIDLYTVVSIVSDGTVGFETKVATIDSTSTAYVSVSAGGGDFTDTINGPFLALRAEKIGDSGVADLIAFL